MEKKKNVLMVCVDHWPGSFFGCCGRSDMITPTLDYLADNGIKFENFYSECPVCIPARRSLMTGLYPKTHKDRVYSDRMEMPDVPTLAQVFRDNGYQAYAVGKLHVYPQRNRIGFDDVVLAEEGRYEFGVVDDYQTWLGENGYIGQEFMHGMGNNTYYTRPWHLDEKAHPTNWVTMQMMKQIKRKDPTRPAFFYCSYQFPHPPLVPLQVFLDKYDDVDFEEPIGDDWKDGPIMEKMRSAAKGYSSLEIKEARKAFHAQCTHIDYQIRMLIGTLRECNLLEDTLLVFLSDHGDMLFDHGMVAKRCFYENAAFIPFIVSGSPALEYRNKGYEKRLGSLADLMPTILDICGIKIPGTVEGLSLVGPDVHDFIYGEVGEGEKATRMIRTDKYKLIYYPCGNVFQLFDMDNDRKEMHDLSGDVRYCSVLEDLKKRLVDNLYGQDLNWIENGVLVGFTPSTDKGKPDFGLYNQRGYHWPAPSSYSNLGKNA